MSNLQSEKDPERRVAVIGSGISGLSAAWLISRRMPVTLYERDSRLGGHAHTVELPTPDGPVAVDTGFIVYNDRNYPNLTAFFQELGVVTRASEMSFSASLRGGAVEYSGSGVNGLIGQRGNVLRPRFWKMVRDILRFYREAPRLLTEAGTDRMTIGSYLSENRYSREFIEDHLLPMAAAIWSTSARDIKAYPLAAFLRFFQSHGLLQLDDRPSWRTVVGGSREYVARIRRELPGTVILSTPVVSISREADQVVVTDASGASQSFTDIVIATHADQALAMLADPSAEERALLGAFRYTPNVAVLHQDTSLMPKRRRVWSSWNYIDDRNGEDGGPLCVTYWMNRLQGIDERHPVFVTLNPGRPIDERLVAGRFDYTHPLFDQAALDAQSSLWTLQGKRRTWFAGSYFGNGFHEDGLQSGLAAAEGVAGVARPWVWEVESSRLVHSRRHEPAE